jgi:hypothetical protein
VFHYTTYGLALTARKSGIIAQRKFKGVPLSLRQPHLVKGSDFDVFSSGSGGGDSTDCHEDRNNNGDKEEEEDISSSSGSTMAMRKFPNEEVLVLSLPRHLLDPLPGYEDDNGLCMISTQVLNALRPTSFTAVVDSQPWLDGLVMLPPQCILRSFVILDPTTKKKTTTKNTTTTTTTAMTTNSINPTAATTQGYRQSSQSSFNNNSSNSNNYNNTMRSISTSSHPTRFFGQNNPTLSSSLKYPSSSSSSLATSAASSSSLNYVMDDTISSQFVEQRKINHITSLGDYIDQMRRIRQKAFEKKLLPLFHYTSPNVASLILQSGLRMSTQGQGDGGVYVSTQGPASYGLGTDEYEVNIIKDCFGVERLKEYEGKGKLDVVLIYGCEGAVLQQVFISFVFFSFIPFFIFSTINVAHRNMLRYD